MAGSRRHILRRHHHSLHGTLRGRFLHSDALALRKPFFVYEPPGLSDLERVPLLYLFRGHEREWVNFQEDASRRRTTALEDLDRRIVAGELPPMLVVLPGLNSANNHVPSLGIDMVGAWPPTKRGLGTGRFWQFLVNELLPRVERDYPEAQGGLRLAAGFSLGGYTATLLGIDLPGYFDHIGIYDGLFMWPGHHDPREPGDAACNDPIWCRASIFDAALGMPRDPFAMRRWNPTDRLVEADAALLDRLRRTTFWIQSAPADGLRGNLDRTTCFIDLLREQGIPLGFDEVVFAPTASHTWHWTDRFLVRFLHAALPPPRPDGRPA